MWGVGCRVYGVWCRVLGEGCHTWARMAHSQRNSELIDSAEADTFRGSSLGLKNRFKHLSDTFKTPSTPGLDTLKTPLTPGLDTFRTLLTPGLHTFNTPLTPGLESFRHLYPLGEDGALAEELRVDRERRCRHLPGFRRGFKTPLRFRVQGSWFMKIGRASCRERV